MKIGDIVKYRTASITTQWDGYIEGKIKTGIIEDIFDSLDKTFKCLWIKGEKELITEYQLMR